MPFTLTWKRLALIAGALAIVALLVLLGFYLRGGTPGTSSGSSSPGGVTLNLPAGANTSTALPSFSSGTSTSQGPRIFEIAQGPVVSATLLSYGTPTTTVSRYVSGNDGHVLDVPLDVPGAAVRLVSNATIPGIERALWTERGSGVILRYLDQGVIKTLHFSLPSAAAVIGSSTALAAVHIAALPDGISSLAAAPDGSQISYLLPGASGSQGYISRPDGTSAKHVFSLPLKQMVLSWPAPGTLLAYSKSASGVSGIALSIDAASGVEMPLLYAQGLTVSANPTFAYALYRTDDGTNASMFAQRFSSGIASSTAWSPFSPPFPENCVWSSDAPVALCPAPAGAAPAGYADLWHRGQSSIADVIAAIDASSGETGIVAVPGGRDGGVAADIIDIALSPGNAYLSYVSKNDGSLWGVRLR